MNTFILLHFQNELKLYEADVQASIIYSFLHLETSQLNLCYASDRSSLPTAMEQGKVSIKYINATSNQTSMVM